ncbi:MAG: MurR/RpiR family transcriptional regulator [Lachnospiraceae bacterium]|jgi:DNA-binding MurR/RpiR family transcriptional regulator|nr:MurR/RpiR family transcriptional regulator [Lachnospiraceae bacterium]MCI1423798.1 MurR/RpiR family transcriptional regulator [Lachnospiraceae bacterium]MCI1452598.1 MurR/RpiR family transcriptional regulator [Lachnospiraceae bacterium]MDD5848035.1 MurR/RpiR family transcriptional regulator [Bacillota bacterium]
MEQDNGNLLLSIQLNYNQFTRTEKKIADYVLQNAQDVPFMSITELAEGCGVAEASVHRFCRTLQIKGYQNFKMQLSLSLHDGRQEAHDTGAGTGEAREENLFQKILNNNLSAIRETSALLDREVVEKTVRLMSAAQRIFFLGVGNSMITAEEAQGRFLHITPKVQYVVDTHMQAMAASMLTPQDMLIFISYSGSTSDNVRVAALGRACGARISVITRYPKSALTKYADTVLICGSKEGPLEGGSMGAKMSQLYIVEVLFQLYYQMNPEESKANNKKTAAAIVDRYEDR